MKPHQSQKEQWICNTCHIMHEPQKQEAKLNKPDGKDTEYTIPPLWNIWNRQIIGTESRWEATRCWGGAGSGRGSYWLMDTEFPSGVMKLWKQTSVMLMQHRTQCHQTVGLTMVMMANFKLCIFYHNFIKFAFRKKTNYIYKNGEEL